MTWWLSYSCNKVTGGNMSLSIASAFRLRNKLKERIKRLSEIAGRAETTKPEGTDENTAIFDGKTFKQTIEEVSVLMTVLRDFNIAIEKSNSINKEALINLESLKAEIAFYENITQKVRSAPLYSYEYNAEGGRDKIKQEVLLSQKEIVAHLDSLKKRKDEIEEKLAKSNIETQVDFDQSAITKLL
jgi:gamma-glutamylcyclotransferase (GGCT)/AIG2-like uncharacterized protein YtfP